MNAYFFFKVKKSKNITAAARDLMEDAEEAMAVKPATPKLVRKASVSQRAGNTPKSAMKSSDEGV